MYTAQGRINRSFTVDAHMPMVRRHALSLQVRLPPSVELDDLIQAGLVGLLDAFDRYDSDQGATFGTYASQRVRGAMLDELRSRDWLPRSVRRGARDISKTTTRLQNELGRAPSEREIATAMGITINAYHHVLGDVNNGYLTSYEENGSEDSEPSRVAGDISSFIDPFLASLNHARRDHLIAAIDKLPEREKTLLGLYYQEDLNLKEIGAVLGVSESRVCQLHSQAVARLRAAMPKDD